MLAGWCIKAQSSSGSRVAACSRQQLCLCCTLQPHATTHLPMLLHHPSAAADVTACRCCACVCPTNMPTGPWCILQAGAARQCLHMLPGGDAADAPDLRKPQLCTAARAPVQRLVGHEQGLCTLEAGGRTRAAALLDGRNGELPAAADAGVQPPKAS